MFRFLRIAIGVVLILFSILGVLVGILAILDPAGTKMADDNDPFGSPPSRTSSALITLGYVGVGAAGCALMIWSPRGKKQIEQTDAENP